MKSHIALVITAALLTASCGKKEEPRSEAPQPAPAQYQGMNTPGTPVPERPAPDVAAGTASQLPKPGQVNDHSSPEFKGGGVSGGK